MKASELRIGNWVNCSEIVDVDKTREISCWDFGTYLSTNPEYYIPIPLTEEWLRRFGFVKVSEFGISQYGNGKIGIFFYNGKGNYNISMFEHVHQLQNLYFALTGEELTIKQ